jgi:hypothetical protein
MVESNSFIIDNVDSYYDTSQIAGYNYVKILIHD